MFESEPVTNWPKISNVYKKIIWADLNFRLD